MDPLPPVYTQKNWIKVAAGYDDYQKSLGCGMCLKVTGTGKGSGSNPIIGPYYAVVVDLCDGCKQGQFYLVILMYAVYPTQQSQNICFELNNAGFQTLRR